MPVSLTPRERVKLKARAHALAPVVQLGHARVSASVVAEVDRALTAHQLIKVRIGVDDRDERHEVGDTLCERTDAAAVQRVGKIIVLWRPKPEEEK
jgi:putative YhbY family RNA-binding protein